MEELFSNPFWHALSTEQAALALGAGAALRYPADIIPFAALRESAGEALAALVPLLAPGEDIYVTGDPLPQVDGLLYLKQLPCLQLHLEGAPTMDTLPSSGVQIEPLGAADSAAMVGLTDVAFPGFFRSRTYVLGSYFGIHIDGQLIAMAGERIALPGYREISAVCTHPDHLGRGFAALLIRHLLSIHAAAGLRSFLHVAATNHRAIALYERLGFTRTRTILIHQLRRAVYSNSPVGVEGGANRNVIFLKKNDTGQIVPLHSYKRIALNPPGLSRVIRTNQTRKLTNLLAHPSLIPAQFLRH